MRREHVGTFVDRCIDSKRVHVWPFQSVFPIDVRALVLDRKSEIPLHRPDHLEVVICEAGQLGYEIQNTTRTLGKDDIVVVGSQCHHRCLPSTSGLFFTTVLAFRPEAVHSGIPLSDDLCYLMPFDLRLTGTSNVIRADSALAKEVRDLIFRIQHVLSENSDHSRLAARTYLKMLLLSLIEPWEDTCGVQTVAKRHRDAVLRLMPVFEYVQKNYSDSIRVAEISREAGTSTSRFMNLFKEVTGQSFIAYLNRFRVAQAKVLLANTQKTIAEISQDAGFCNQSYFGVIFQRITGETPGGYKKRLAVEESPVPPHTAVRPPSTVKIPPTQYVDSSEAR